MKKLRTCSLTLHGKLLTKTLKVMKISFVLLFAASFNLLALDVLSQEDGKLTVDFHNSTIKQAFNKIEEITGYEFFYHLDRVDLDRKVDVAGENLSMEEVLDKLLAGTGSEFKIVGKHILIVGVETVVNEQQQGITVSGRIVDSHGEPVPGTSVVVQGTLQGTITDMDGNYKLDNVPANAVLQYSFVGMKQQSFEVNGRTQINVTMEEETIGLQEVVAIGYGTMRKSDVTGATSRLTEDRMNKSVATSPTEMMQGRVAGVNVSHNNGSPGAGMSVRVRGNNSIRSGQEPLYVVDGVPLDNADLTPNGAAAPGISGSANKNPISFLNPDDIETIDILKDASSTAIYGARGANGVIIITTKKGSRGEGTLSYDGYVGVSAIREKLDVLSAEDFRSYTKADGSKLLDLGASTDWQDEIYRTAITHSHNLSYGGATENFGYRASVGYINQEGIVESTGQEKINGNVKVNQKALNGRLNLDGTLVASHVEDTRAPIGETGGFEGDLILTALKLNPTYPVFNPDGSYYQHSVEQRNPVAMINLTDDITETDRILTNMSAELELIDNLKYKINIGLDRTVSERKVNQQYELNYLPNKGDATINSITANNRLVENFVTYDFDVNDRHRFNALAGHAYQYFKVSGSSIYVNGFEVDDIKYTDNLGYGNFSAGIADSYAIESELQSFFGRFNYSLDNKYLFTLTGRADGSTRFGKNNKYGYFPSAAFAWRLSEEPFISDMNAFSNLKFRLGWGQTGNQEIPDKISLRSVGTQPSANGFFNGEVSTGIGFIRTPNPDIKWETTTQWNMGVDFGFFDNRLSGVIDLYHKTTKDVLIEIASKGIAPTETQWQNVPDLEIINKGVELGLNGVLVSNNKLTWNMGVNFAYLYNDVRNLPVKLIETGVASGQGLSETRVQVITNDEPIGTFYGRVFEGFDSNGFSIFKQDEKGNDAMEPIGSALPDFTLSFNTSLNYKNFDASMFWYGSLGNDVYNNTANALFIKGPLDKGNNVTKKVLNSEESPANPNAFSSRFVEDASFFRFANLTLGYTFKANNIDWLSQARVYVTGNNLLVITSYSGYDPEVSSDASYKGVPSMGIDYTSYPAPRTFTFGVSLKF